ncbi:MAG TPA: aspartyl protease family protein [Kofleriaceae bacterium]|nr:aspartyl protease family protein [Kofleriaceae bacterium]
MRTCLAILVAAACSHPAPPASPAAPLAAPGGLPPLVAAFRDATGGAAWDGLHGLSTRATVSIGGMTGTSETIEDIPSGRSRSAIHLPALDQADGFDGTTAWERAPGGEVAIQDAPDAVARARTDAWMTRHAMFHPGGARYRELGVRDDTHGVHYRVLEATPDGGAPIELWFAPSGLLARTVTHQGIDTVTTELADWRAVGPVKLPFAITVVEGDVRNTLAMHVTAYELVATPEAATFAPPKLDADRLRFAPGVSRSELPFDLVNNHIYVNASVDGKPLRMLVDTGGLNMLTPAAAKRLGLEPEGKIAGSGAGAERVDVGFAHAKQLQVGDVTLANPVFYVIDIGALADVEGEPFDGLVGFELFSRLGVRIDYPGRRLSLIAPAAFEPPHGAIAVPFEMADRTPIVQGAIDGLPGRFWVDTGSRSSLTTMTKFTRDHELVARYKPAFSTVTGWGVGGSTTSAPVRFHEVKIGDAVVHDVVGDLFTGDKGSFADPDAAANLGGGILHRFVVTFDYAKKVMYLEPGKDVDRREAYDRSGLFLIRDGDALRAVSVVPGSGAARAGIRANDRIAEIDGAPVGRKSLAEWRAELRDSPVGTRVRMHVVSGTRGDVIVTLSELVP